MAVFPSLVPRLSDDLWFSIDKRFDDDAALTKEEDEYTAQLHTVVEKGNDIVPLGKSKESNEGQEEEEEEEMEDEEDSAEELEDETDDYESPSPDAESVEGEVEMMDSSFL
ncbi:anaphase-promoting complex subunit 15 [Exaiptasia diaphana]|uniref:Anaphase-promoting complex subunit 15 n=1 Tax=Exaiptasia diaphana TaxID=2652724 RepID=A0A913XX17_EXADI|nr:anaphase-promoting complex subunit 15 [Exaiptasia diaphana]KXJ28454.1 Anaphase-promoting complex subunit 15 [Exaiptasia diaphana]